MKFYWFKRLLCFIGIHWSGQSGLGSMHNSKDCRVCGRVHVMGLLVNDSNERSGGLLVRICGIVTGICAALLPVVLLIMLVTILVAGRNQ